MQAWEFGAKTDWELAGFMRLNGALFLNDYTDKQIGTQVVNDDGILQPRVVNAAAAEVWGVEIEALWQPEFLEGLLLSVNYTYLRAEFVDFIDLTRSSIRSAYAGQCNLIGLDDSGNQVPFQSVDSSRRFCALNFNGNKLERTPEHAAVFNVQYTAPFMAPGVGSLLLLN